MDSLARKIVKKQIASGNIDMAKEDMYIYGYQVFLEKTISYILIAVIAVLFNKEWDVLIVCVSFIPLRSYAGGIHAKSAVMCFSLTSIVIIVGILLSGSIGMILNKAGIFWICLIELVICICITAVSPVDVLERRLNNKEKHIYKERLKRIVVIEYVIYVVLSLLNTGWILLITYSHLIILLSCTMQIIKNKKNYA